MNIVTKIGGGKVQHAASYDSSTGKIDLLCNSLKFTTYYAHIVDPSPPTKGNITCKKCLKKI
ncbi:hypothetical protein ACU3L3_06950 [Priestia endophytica]